jgi:hypothetical protein
LEAPKRWLVGMSSGYALTMNCISLVCTVHEEVGLANVSELHAILMRICPKVIFLEVPSAAFSDFYETREQRNLESIAVRIYLESHLVELVPVDLPTPKREFFEDHEQMHMRIRAASHEYRQLLNLNSEYIRRYGFAYLNSEYSSKAQSDIDAEILSTIRELDDSKLLEINGLWMETNRLREIEWMENILRYCRLNTFGTGVFLVGAAHRRSMIEKSREQQFIDSVRLQWNFIVELSSA